MRAATPLPAAPAGFSLKIKPERSRAEFVTEFPSTTSGLANVTRRLTLPLRQELGLLAMNTLTFLRRREAAHYIRSKIAIVTPATLAKLATVGGGPSITYAGKVPLYSTEALDAWITSKLSKPARSTSELSLNNKCGGLP